MSKITLVEKANYIDNLINTEKYINPKDTKVYEYLYDLVQFCVTKKISHMSLPSDFIEEFTQNIIFQIFQRFRVPSKIEEEMKSFSYVKKCVKTELSKLNSDKYSGQSYIYQGFDLEAYFNGEEVSYDNSSEIELIMSFEKNAKKLIERVQGLVYRSIIPVPNKRLLIFPLLLAICREDENMLNKYPQRVKTILKQIYYEVGSPQELMLNE